MERVVITASIVCYWGLRREGGCLPGLDAGTPRLGGLCPCGSSGYTERATTKPSGTSSSSACLDFTRARSSVGDGTVTVIGPRAFCPAKHKYRTSPRALRLP